MPRPGEVRVVEKSKDFKGSMIRLFKNLRPWKFLMGLALCLAMISAILALIAPDKLSELTDTITDGISLNTKKLQEISEEIAVNLSGEKMQLKMAMVFMDVSMTDDEKLHVQEVFNKIAISSNWEGSGLLLTLPDKVLAYLLEDIVVDGQIISVEDQISLLNLTTLIVEKVETENLLGLVDELPESIYSLVKPKIDMDKIKEIALFMGMLYLTSAIFNFIQSYSLTTVSNRFANRLRDNISKKINRLPLKYFDMHETGDVLSRITNDVDMVAQNLNSSLATLVTSITLFIGSSIMMFTTNWIMAITAVLSSVLGFFGMFSILTKSQKYFNQRQVALGDMNGYIEEMYSGHNVVKAYNGREEAICEFEKLNERMYETNRRVNSYLE